MSRIWILAGALALASATAVAGDAKSRVKSGDAAPDFTLKTLDGKERNLAFFRGDKKDKIVVVDFWSHACPWSRAWDGELSKIAKDFASKNVVVVAIDSNKPDKVEDIQKYAKDKSLAFEVFVDADAKVADAFGGQTTPDIFVIGADGKVRYTGAVNDMRDPSNPTEFKSSYLRDALEAIAAGKAIAKPDTKNQGCSIKRGDKAAS